MANIKKRKHDAKSDDIVEFWFDNESWVRIDLIDEMYEYQSNPKDGETYISGMLQFEDNVLVDYDGCYELPDEVIEAVKDLGHEIDRYITLK